MERATRTVTETLTEFRIIGNVGAGKGTQGRHYRERMSAPEIREMGLIYGEIVMGDIFRGALKDLPGFGDYRRLITERSFELMGMGKVALDEDAMNIYKLAHSRHIDKGVNVLWTDGAPRSLKQQSVMEQYDAEQTRTPGNPNPDVYYVALDLHDNDVPHRLGGRLMEDMYGSKEHPAIAHLNGHHLISKLISDFPKALANGDVRKDDDPRKWGTRVFDYNEFTIHVIHQLDQTLPKGRILHVDARLPEDVVHAKIWQFTEPNFPHHAFVVKNGIARPSHEEPHLWVLNANHHNGEKPSQNGKH